LYFYAFYQKSVRFPSQFFTCPVDPGPSSILLGSAPPQTSLAGNVYWFLGAISWSLEIDHSFSGAWEALVLGMLYSFNTGLSGK